MITELYIGAPVLINGAVSATVTETRPIPGDFTLGNRPLTFVMVRFADGHEEGFTDEYVTLAD